MPNRAKHTASSIRLRSFSTIMSVMAVMSMEGCGDPCLDDGPSIGTCKNAAASGSETQATSGAESNDGTADGTADAEAGTNSGSAEGDGDPGDGDDGDGDGDPGDGDTGDDDPGDGDGDDPCHNGMHDPGETGVDCGGVCVWVNPLNEDDVEGQCNEGDPCDEIEDCVAGECSDAGICNVCPDERPPEFDPMDLGYNDCQSCLLTNCCDAVISCFQNIEKCVCWFNCVEHTGATQTCMDQCGNGNIGGINSCMNSSCKASGNQQNCSAP
ncbi:hypothetical protein [Enhygromyxa salina]|uniref:Endo-1,4-beta-xylanase A n=1 Tax=Enhygromyxa salina TaxID=215803 RepID=A0A2S9YY75_9BACT|nr:hypothetical protein [Enhygromyxa salina]PRQ10048.1 hypothetical protein ENSA7_02540 [Enhygromyxa salina]